MPTVTNMVSVVSSQLPTPSPLCLNRSKSWTSCRTTNPTKRKTNSRRRRFAAGLFPLLSITTVDSRGSTCRQLTILADLRPKKRCTHSRTRLSSIGKVVQCSKKKPRSMNRWFKWRRKLKAGKGKGTEGNRVWSLSSRRFTRSPWSLKRFSRPWSGECSRSTL